MASLVSLPDELLLQIFTATHDWGARMPNSAAYVLPRVCKKFNRILCKLYTWAVEQPTRYIGQTDRDGTSRMSSVWRWLNARQDAVRKLSVTCNSEASCACTTGLIQLLGSGLEHVTIHCEEPRSQHWAMLQHILNEMGHCPRLRHACIFYTTSGLPRGESLDIGRLCHAPCLEVLNVDFFISPCFARTAGAQLGALRSLTCSHSSDLVKVLPMLTRLTELDLRGAVPVPDGMPLFLTSGEALSAALHALPQLQTLSLRRLQGLYWLSLAELPRLHELHLCDLPLTSLPSMQGMSNLRSLRLDMPLGKPDLDEIVDELLYSRLTALTSLSVLDLGNTGLPENVLNLRQLRELWYDGLWETLPAIGQLHELQRLTLHCSSHETILLDLTPLAAMRSLSVLDLSGCSNIDVIGTVTVDEFMHGDKATRHLHFGTNSHINFSIG